MKDRQWKDYWDVDLGVSYIPIDKLDPQVPLCTALVHLYERPNSPCLIGKHGYVGGRRDV